MKYGSGFDNWREKIKCDPFGVPQLHLCYCEAV